MVQRNVNAEWVKTEDFMARNPKVYELLVENCRLWIRRNPPVGGGVRRWAIGSAWERMRWVLNIEVDADGDYALNDRLRAYYARLLMAQEPDLDGMFEVRASEADGWLHWHLDGCPVRQANAEARCIRITGGDMLMRMEGIAA